MKERLTNNLFIKLLSVFIALSLWILIVNFSNPLKTKTISDIPLEVLNENVLTDAEITYEIEGKKSVSVSVDVRTLDYNRIQKSDFRAYVDLKDLWAVTGTVPVKIEVVNNRNLMEGEPVAGTEVVHVVTEPLQKKVFQIKTYTKGALPDGYALGDIAVTPATVQVKGPESRIGLISSVGIEVDIDGKESDIFGTAAPVFYDANGHELGLDSKVTMNVDSVRYEQQVLRIKELALNFDITGNVAEGYRFTGTACEYKSIPVAGFRSVLAELNALNITDPELSLDGLRKDKTVQIDLNKYLPNSSLSLAGMDSSIIAVTLKVEPLVSQDFVVATANVPMIGQDSDFTYSFDERNIEVTVQGLQDDLDQLKASQMGISLDVSEMGEGSNEGVLTFDLDDSFVVQGYSPFMVTVKAKNNAPSPGDQEGISGEGMTKPDPESDAVKTTEPSETGETAEKGGTKETENNKTTKKNIASNRN